MHIPIPSTYEPGVMERKLRHELQTLTDLGALMVDIADAQKRVELLINMTPTGNDRNVLCDLNIHLMAALALLKDD